MEITVWYEDGSDVIVKADAVVMRELNDNLLGMQAIRQIGTLCVHPDYACFEKQV
jgi:hypothetical protein